MSPQPGFCLSGGRAPTAPRHLLCHPLSLLPMPGSRFLCLSTACVSLPPRFMEFEAEEEMQIQKLQLMKGAQGQPPPAPPRPDPQGSPAPVLGPQPGTPGPSHRSPGPRPQGPRTGPVPTLIGPFPSRGFGLSTETTMRAEASVALCHHGVWTWSPLITPLPPPCKGPTYSLLRSKLGGPHGVLVAPQVFTHDCWMLPLPLLSQGHRASGGPDPGTPM